MFEQTNHILSCSLCNKVLVDPVELACGSTICKGHINKMLENVKSGEQNKSKCRLSYSNKIFVLNKKNSFVNFI